MIQIGSGSLDLGTYFKMFTLLKNGGFIKINDQYGLRLCKKGNYMNLELYVIGQEESVDRILVGMTELVPRVKKVKPAKKKDTMFEVDEVGTTDLF